MTPTPSPGAPEPSATTPRGFVTHTANVGIKDASLDFAIVASQVPCVAAGMFTQSRFAGPSVQISREHMADGVAQAIVTISKNANVATGERGLKDSRRVVEGVAAALGIGPANVLISSTGVIGRPLPMERIDAHLEALTGQFGPADFARVAEAIMTTDTVAKHVVARVGDATIVGVAKGVGMIEPDMATLLTYFFTDADVPLANLRAIFARVVEATFNSLSIDTDTSTSDTAIILANAQAGAVDLESFETTLFSVALQLVKMIAGDGEGATRIIEVTVDQARDHDQAKRVAKLIVNSPLVKTAVHGRDPNWGRVAMAVGKAKHDLDIDPSHTTIRFGAIEVYPKLLDDHDLAALSKLMADDEVLIHVSLATGVASATVWGCDLSDGYVRINADYTT